MLNAPLQMFVLLLAGWVNEQLRAINAYLREENGVVRELHGRKRLRFTDDQRRRLAAKGKPRRGLREFSRGDRDAGHDPTLASGVDRGEVRWKRDARPWPTGDSGEIRALAVRMASDKEGWGYTRIVGELWKLGHRVSRSTVRRILKERGIGPAPERLPHMP